MNKKQNSPFVVKSEMQIKRRKSPTKFKSRGGQNDSSHSSILTDERVVTISIQKTPSQSSFSSASKEPTQSVSQSALYRPQLSVSSACGYGENARINIATQSPKKINTKMERPSVNRLVPFNTDLPKEYVERKKRERPTKRIPKANQQNEKIEKVDVFTSTVQNNENMNEEEEEANEIQLESSEISLTSENESSNAPKLEISHLESDNDLDSKSTQTPKKIVPPKDEDTEVELEESQEKPEEQKTKKAKRSKIPTKSKHTKDNGKGAASNKKKEMVDMQTSPKRPKEQNNQQKLNADAVELETNSSLSNSDFEDNNKENVQRSNEEQQQEPSEQDNKKKNNTESKRDEQHNKDELTIFKGNEIVNFLNSKNLRPITGDEIGEILEISEEEEEEEDAFDPSPRNQKSPSPKPYESVSLESDSSQSSNQSNQNTRNSEKNNSNTNQLQNQKNKENEEKTTPIKQIENNQISSQNGNNDESNNVSPEYVSATFLSSETSLSPGKIGMFMHEKEVGKSPIKEYGQTEVNTPEDIGIWLV